jgi:regulator of sigma E protease
MLTLAAFVVTLGVLITVHEWGHYRMAVACGVKALRFSIGLGPVALRWKPKRQRPGQDTEFVLCWMPFGGYLKMLDEREAPVPPEERHLAFNTQPLTRRALIVAAGPVSHVALAVLLYAAVKWIGVEEPRAILSPPVAQSLAARAGLQGGDTVRRAALAGDELAPVASFESLRWLLTRGALSSEDVTLEVARAADERVAQVTLPMSALATREPDAGLFRAIGILSPLSRPAIGEIIPGGAAERAGLRRGDLVLEVDGMPVQDGQQLIELIRVTGAHGEPAAARWRLLRDGAQVELQVKPDLADDKGQPVGRIGAMVGARPAMALVRLGPVEGLTAGARQTWQVAWLSLKLLGRMVIGKVKLKNLSGPIAIADYAGKSAALGLTYFLSFLAFVSVSLGVLNLLPVPVLDGGHLMYYLWEGVTGKPVSDVWLERLQYVGMALLFAMMSIAVFNDVVSRIG